jgi:hypothetical protein
MKIQSETIYHPLEDLLLTLRKADLIDYLRFHPSKFPKLVQLALSGKPRVAWRASWLLWSCMEYNDQRVTPAIPTIIEFLPGLQENRLREWLIILQKVDIPTELEGKLFSICSNVWTNSSYVASVRYNAFRLIIRIAGHHPELKKEVMYLTEPQYIGNLSSTGQRCILKMAGTNL